MKQSLILSGGWQVKEVKDIFTADFTANTGNWLPAAVPGDIHKDLMGAGLIPDPYYSDNIEECKWVTETDWCYKRDFEIEKSFLSAQSFLRFKGIDTFAEIYLNGQLLGETQNMFLEYRYNVTNIIKEGANTIAVHIRSVKKEHDKYKGSDLNACFDLERIFLRKAQCQFSWDWAPNIPATGIWQDVILESSGCNIIDNIFVISKTCGDICAEIELRDDGYIKIPHKAKLEIFCEDKTVTKEIEFAGYTAK